VSQPVLREGGAAATSVLWATGFRPFFLLAGLHGCTFLLFWIAILLGWLQGPLWLVPMWWHGHEMLFGFVCAAIAGFLLTAVPVWTGTPHPTGAPLVALALLWLSGRVAMMAAGFLPRLVPPLLDLAFLPALAIPLAPRLFGARRARNYGFVPILLALFVANALMHLQVLGVAGARADLGVRLAVNLVMLLVVIIGGRIVPNFTTNALRRNGVVVEIRSRRWVEVLTVPAVLAFTAADLFAPPSATSGLPALVAGGVLLVRLAGWQGLRTRGDALRWSLHLGYLWIPAGLICLGMSSLTELVPRASGIHAITAGAFGTMILTVMSRVSLGHTGRELVAPPAISVAYALITLAALLRMAGPILIPQAQLPTLVASGLCFSAAFAIFTATYAPILLAPRVDGGAG
jgi:uncharacterized protein involved in response to NO